MMVTTKATEYQGNATLEFTNGSGRPFSLGAYKLRVILTALPDVRAWLTENGEAIPSEAIPQASEPTAPATGQPHLFDGLLTDLASRVETLEATPRPAVDALATRIETLEATINIILEEIAGSASPAPETQADVNPGHRSLQID